MIRRRAKQKRAAREALEPALRIFEDLGAPLWADKARAELARVKERRSMGGELTPVERRVARVAAARSHEQGDRRFALHEPRTVGGHLSSVYANLGIRSRTELAAFPGLVQREALHSWVTPGPMTGYRKDSRGSHAP